MSRVTEPVPTGSKVWFIVSRIACLCLNLLLSPRELCRVRLCARLGLGWITSTHISPTEAFTWRSARTIFSHMCVSDLFTYWIQFINWNFPQSCKVVHRIKDKLIQTGLWCKRLTVPFFTPSAVIDYILCAVSFHSIKVTEGLSHLDWWETPRTGFGVLYVATVNNCAC